MDGNETNPLYTDPQQNVSNSLKFNDDVGKIADPLALEVEDDDLIRIVDQRIKDSQLFFEEKYNLSERRKKNETYLFGRQVADKEKQGILKDYETRSADNVLYEIEASLKPLAMSKLPDIIVTPGADDPARKQSADDVTTVVNDVNKQQSQKEMMGIAFKHLPVYFTAVLKAKWNSEKGSDGDYEFCNVRPEYVVVDHTCPTKNPDDMGFIAQCVPMTVQEAVMKFPKAKEDFYAALQRHGVMVGSEPTWQDMATEVKIWEVWFDWYKQKGSDELVNKDNMETMSLLEPGIKWEKLCGVLWKYEKVILDKMLDPNFDHEGEERIFSYSNPADENSKQEVQPQDLLLGQMAGISLPNLKKEKVYHNYFQRPKKPYYFMGYDQWGKVYLDETSRIEQNIRNQENLDDQNQTILDQIKKRVKHIWSRESGLTKADVQRLDMDAPKMDVMVEGDPNAVHATVNPERPDQAQFNALNDTRSRMYGMAHASAIRGELQSDVATSNQIGREGDFTVSDDLVQDTVNAAYLWMAQWQMQFIKLRYTSEHLKEILGSKGETTYVRLRRDTIADGMEVMIKASSTDKLKAQRNAMDTAKLGPPYTNPLDFFRDMDMSDPEGRVERGMTFMLDPQGYYSKFVLGLKDVTAQAGAINQAVGQPAAPPMMGAQPPVPPGMPPAPIGAPGPQLPNAADTSQVPTTQPTFPQGSPRGL